MAHCSLPLWNPVLRKAVYPCHEGIMGEQWSTPCLGQFTPREETLYPLNKRQGGPTACLDILEKRKVACLYCGPQPVSCSL